MNYQNTIYVRLKEFKFKKSEDGALSKLYDVSAVVSGDSDVTADTCDLVSGVTKIF